jgi:hypothetical protein
MPRHRFLLGTLCGLIVGVGVGLLTPKPDAPSMPVPIQPVSTNPREPSSPQRPQNIPPDARRHEFNGGEFYIIPLASRD